MILIHPFLSAGLILGMGFVIGYQTRKAMEMTDNILALNQIAAELRAEYLKNAAEDYQNDETSDPGFGQTETPLHPDRHA